MEASLRLWLFVAGFTVGSGVFDSIAFTHAARMWKDGGLVWREAAISASSFAIGLALYCVAVRFLVEAGVVEAELQTLLWFAVTILGVAILGGQFLQWQPLEQLVALNVLLGLGWLISRAAA